MSQIGYSCTSVV